MKRLLAFLALIGSCAAAGWAAYGLLTTLQAPAYKLPHVQISGQLAVPDAPDLARPFMAIYGEPAAIETSVQVAAAAPKSFDFVLKGLIALGDTRWAVLSKGGVDVVVREGEAIEDGVEVLHIRAEGIELATDDGPMSLGFNSETPVALAEISPGASGTEGADPKGNFRSGTPTAVLFQDMSSDDILAALEQAEQQRIARGWVPASD